MASRKVSRYRTGKAIRPMSVVRVLALVVFCALPASAAAQAWADAYRAGDYDKAALLLQQVVIESVHDLVTVVPEPYRQLSLMYAEGRGVPRDAIAACTLARVAGQATMIAAPKRHSQDLTAYDAAHKESDEFIRTHCESLAADDRLAAERSIGCLALRMPDETVSVGEHSVRIGRRGISLADGSEQPWELYGCPQFVALVRTRSIAPPDDPAPGVRPRHFIELFFWTIGSREGGPLWALQWHVYEVSMKGTHFFLADQGLTTQASFPGSGLPVGVEKALSLEMIRSGHVRWKLDGAPPKRGWFMIGEGIRR